MKRTVNKSALILSAAITAFVLLILSGVLYSVKQVRQASAASEPAAQDLSESEAAYQALIKQANQRLEQTQAEIQRLQSQSDQVDEPTSVTMEQAAQLAANYTGQSEIYSAETSAIDGQSAYRVTFTSGDLVFVSLTGEILSVQPASQGFSISSSSSHSDDDDGYDDDDEDDEDDEDEDDGHDDKDGYDEDEEHEREEYEDED